MGIYRLKEVVNWYITGATSLVVILSSNAVVFTPKMHYGYGDCCTSCTSGILVCHGDKFLGRVDSPSKSRLFKKVFSLDIEHV